MRGEGRLRMARGLIRLCAVGPCTIDLCAVGKACYRAKDLFEPLVELPQIQLGPRGLRYRLHHIGRRGCLLTKRDH